MVCLLSSTKKMPCSSFSISPENCITGRKLAKVKGSVCSICYAKRGNYPFPRVKNAHKERFKLLADLEAFVPIMVNAINQDERMFFRWHDSGDIQSMDHLLAIFEVCKKTPKVKHWLPTHEYGIIRQLKRKAIPTPKNLIIRVSGAMIGGKVPTLGRNTSTIHVKGQTPYGFECMAKSRGGSCGDCRACWDGRVRNISYPRT